MSQETYINSSDLSAQLPLFSELLLELSAKLTGVSACDLEREIEKDLRIINDYLDFDWLTFCEFSDNADGFERAFNRILSYYVPEVNHPPIETIHKDTAYLTERVANGKTVFMRSVADDLPKNAKWDRLFCMNEGIKTSLALPLKSDNEIIGALYFASIRSKRLLTDRTLRDLYFFGEILAGVLKGRRIVREDRHEHIFINNTQSEAGDVIIGNSSIFRNVLKKAKRIAQTDALVLLTGETGTGKGVIAKFIHNAGQRRGKPVVQVNCAGFAPGLIESELFGHEKGAYTGAYSRRIGCFERAHGSTLFLDEIGDIPQELQGKLLRVLQDGEFERVGGSNTIKTNARVIAATNKDLENEVKAGKFRKDLWYRLNMYPVHIPPLRERLEDISLLADFFIGKYSKWAGKSFRKVPKTSMESIAGYSWPGNIRELESLIMRSVIDSSEDELRIEIPENHQVCNEIKPLEDMEKEHILLALNEKSWRIEGPFGAARLLNINPSTLRLRMKKYNIKRPQ